MNNVWLPENEFLFENRNLLCQALSRYRRILDGEGYAFWEWGLEDGTYCSGGSYWKKLGYDTVDKDIVHVERVQEYIHPDDFGYVYNCFIEHLRNNTPLDMVYRIRAKDGTYWWTQASASSVRNKEGRVTHLTGINFDLSHLKETEKALRLTEARHERVLKASNDGIWEWSATDANDDPKKAGKKGKLHTSYSFWSHLGYSEVEVDSLPQDERLSIWRSHIHPYDIKKLNYALARHFTCREPFDCEYRMFGDNGEMFWVRSRGTSIVNTHGRVILMSGININITAMKESEERVRKAKEDAERANRSKSHFLSSMSHELRTPLNSILGFSRLLATDDSMTQIQKENAGYINQAGQYLLQLINDVLDLAQIESGKLSLMTEQVEPAPLVKDSFNYCKNNAQERGIILRLDTAGMDDCVIEVDATRLRQCLLNLINNAIKYNIDGGQVDVVFREVDGQLEISVKDTGPGIPKEKRDSLFEMFNRLGAELSTIEGSGVGLVITRQMAIAMGGDLIYCDQSAPGACFKLYFPLVERQASIEAALKPATSVSPDSIRLDFVDKKNIFYIEDNPSNIRLLEASLKPFPQLELLSHEEPLLGLYHIRRQLPDLVLLDINLPGISGYDLLKVLKQDVRTKHLPVVALSASAMKQERHKGQMAGFDEYLTKPLDMGKLAAVLNQFFVNRAA